MRPVSIQRHYIKNPAGSCLVSFGDTKVICTCSVSEGAPPFLKSGGWLTAEYAMLPGSVSGGRKKRDGAKKDGRSVEIQRLIGRSLRAAVNLAALPEVTLTVDCDVLQADGGTRTAAISGGWVALMDALATLAEAQTASTQNAAEQSMPLDSSSAAAAALSPSVPGTAKGNASAAGLSSSAASSAAASGALPAVSGGLPSFDANDPRSRIPGEWLLGRVAAVSVGIVGGEIVCDLDFKADQNAEVDMNVVTRDGVYVELQGTGEKGVFDKKSLDALLAAADEGLAVIAAAQDKALGGF